MCSLCRGVIGECAKCKNEIFDWEDALHIYLPDGDEKLICENCKPQFTEFKKKVLIMWQEEVSE